MVIESRLKGTPARRLPTRCRILFNLSDRPAPGLHRPNNTQPTYKTTSNLFVVVPSSSSSLLCICVSSARPLDVPFLSRLLVALSLLSLFFVIFLSRFRQFVSTTIWVLNMEIAYPSTPSHIHAPTMGLLPSALSTVTPPPTKKRPLQETTAHNIPLIASPIPILGKPHRIAEQLDAFTPPDSRKKIRTETVCLWCVAAYW
jgi:hypothetical protein